MAEYTRITKALVENIEQELKADIIDPENISLNEIVGENTLKGIETLNHLFTTNSDYQQKKGHKSAYYNFTSDKQKENIVLAYNILERLREKITGQVIFYINTDRRIDVKKPFEFNVLFRDGNLSDRFSHHGIKMDKIPESKKEVEEDLQNNNRYMSQEIIENRLRFIQNYYANCEQTYYTVYGKGGKAISIDNAQNILSFEKGMSLEEIYKKHKNEIKRELMPEDRYREFAARSSNGYLKLNKQNKIEIVRNDNTVQGQLFAIKEIQHTLYTTALGGKNKGQLLEAQLHAASMLKTDGLEENLLTKYSNDKVISFDEAMIRASGNLSFYKGGDVTFYINGQYYTYQVKGIGGEVKISTIINGIKALYDIFFPAPSFNLKELLSKEEQKSTLQELQQMFSISANEQLDELSVGMKKVQKVLQIK